MTEKVKATTRQNIQNVLLMTLIFFILGRLAHVHFMFDIINHFKPVTLLFFSLCIVLLLNIQYQHRLWIYIGIAWLLNWGMIPSFSVVKIASDAPTMKLMHFNLLVNNYHHHKVIDMVEEHRPHIISFQEVTDDWSASLQLALPQYTFVCHELDTPFGICVASNLPITRQEIFFLGNSRIPSISVQISTESKNLSVVLSHPKPPFNQSFFTQRNEHIMKLIQRFTGEENLILIGDLNNTQWSPIYQQLEDMLQLKNTLSGFQNTWPTVFPFAIFQLDHILIPRDFEIVRAAVLEDIGSDHYPIIAEVLLPSRSDEIQIK